MQLILGSLNLLVESLTSGISIYFVGAMSVLILIDGVSFFTTKKAHLNFKGIVTGLGILGTFLGIFLALLHFDPNKIDESVPSLLEGMKFAFGSSVFGLFLSLTLSIFQNFFPDRASGTPEEKIAIELGKIRHNQLESHTYFGAIRARIEESKESIINLTASQQSDTKEIIKSLSQLQNSNEATATRAEDILERVSELPTPLKELASDFSQFNGKNQTFQSEIKEDFRQTREGLENALEKLSEGANKEIIEALESVMKEFNSKLSEIVGDKFDALKDGCIKLLEWQEGYKSSVAEFEQRLNQAVEGIEKSEDSLKTISGYQSEFSQLSKDSKTAIEAGRGLLEGNSKVAQELSEQLERLNKATITMEGLPEELIEIKKKYEELPEVMQASLDTVNRSFSETNEEMGKATNELNNSLTSLTVKFADNYEAFLSQLERLMTKTNL
ncbi:MAG: hypothetical protein ACSHYB_05030 [Roseibacillus sp.]